MNEKSSLVRIILATDGVWGASQLAEAISAIDGLTCRLGAAHIIGNLLRDYNSYLSNLRVMGLLRKGSPDNWGESNQGGEALARQDHLKMTTLLRQHGINIKEGHLAWQLEFDFDDILEIVPKSHRLEIEFIQMGSPGIISFLQAGIQAAKECKSSLLHIFDTWRHPEEKKRIIKATAAIAEANAEIAQAQADFAKEKVAQEKAATKIASAKALLVESVVEEAISKRPPNQLEYRQKFDSLQVIFRDGGLDTKQTQTAIFQPVEKEMDKLARLQCDGLIKAMALDFIDDSDDSQEKKD